MRRHLQQSRSHNLLKMVQVYGSIVAILLWVLPALAQNLPPIPPEFVPKVPPQAIAYQRAHTVAGLCGLVWNLLGLWLFVICGGAARLRDLLKIPRNSSELPPRMLPLLLYFAAFFVVQTLWTLPISLWRFSIENRFGFGRQSLGFFLGDILKGRLFDLTIVPVLWLGYRFVAKMGVNWWRWMSLALVPLLLFSFVLSPVLVAPAFHTYTPLPEGKIRTDVLDLAAKAGISGARVFVENTSIRTKHVNAYVVGVGVSTRIVFNDTALQTLPEDQLLAVTAHEMGHYVEGHSWFQFVSNVIGSAIFLYTIARLMPSLICRFGVRWKIESLNDLAALPLLYALIAVFMLLQSPIESGISRMLEHRADAFALRLTHEREPIARLFVGFAERDYTDPDPPCLLHLFFGSHPTLNERIQYALFGSTP